MRARVGSIIIGALVMMAIPAAGAESGAASPAKGMGGSSRVETVREAVSSGRRTRRQHLEERLDTIAHREPTLRAFIAVDPAAARASATTADSLRGTSLGGLLDGVVVAVKDNMELAGVATTAGSSRLAALPPAPADATLVTRLRSSGAIVVGRTNMDTWARGVRGLSQVRGQTANPLDERRNAGGSSAGSAAAVAASMVDLAVGTDTCGSLRYPASSVGVYGLRPTPGLVSRAGVVPLSPTQDVVGPIAADVDDLEVLLDVLAGPDAADPLTAAAPAVLPAVRAATLRVGVLRGLGTADGGVVAALRDGGLDVVDAGPVPSMASSGGAASVIGDEFAVVQDQYVRARSSSGARPTVAPWLLPLTVTDQRAYETRLRRRAVMQASLVGLMDRLGVDALAYPTTTSGPALKGARQPSGNCHLAAGSGLPALAVPARHVGGGVPPVGVDLLGRPWSERTLIELARRSVPARSSSTCVPSADGRRSVAGPIGNCGVLYSVG